MIQSENVVRYNTALGTNRNTEIMSYLVIKHIHITFVVITIVLFNLRFVMRTARPERPLPGLLKVIPHINDTMLLFTGLWAMTTAKWVPFVNAQWLGVKIILVVLYILFGVAAMRSAPRSFKANAAYFCGLACTAAIVYLAYFKPF